ncbi:Lipoprotein-releasing system ATP-binding protein LolD [bioreactor metagenome]|uniref:Lipoprotein-releasing system ATP-binding protein LolD n=1 Tax=bioreactor metagenome TaxID=1076179 RepID=A0A644ZG07_9ZZZZ
MITQIKDMVIWADNLTINDSLKDINLIVKKGDLICITGLSTEDKRDFIRVLGCFERPSKGKYVYDYENINLAEYGRLDNIRAGKIGYVFSKPILFEDLNVIQNVTFWMKNICSHKKAQELGHNILKELGMEEKCMFGIEQLNKLEKMIVSFARAAINNPLLLLVDNIFLWLRPADYGKAAELISKFIEKGITVIVFTDFTEYLPEVKKVIHY